MPAFSYFIALAPTKALAGCEINKDLSATVCLVSIREKKMSSDRINIFYELEIKDGKADELREIAKQMVAFNDEGEPETLVYDVYISEDEKLLTFWETHANSDALLFHADRFATGQFVGEVLERTERTRLCLYGNITAEIRKWALDNGFENEYHASIDGFQRV